MVNGVEFDIADDFVWGQILGKLEAGHFAALVASPPCGSFSRVRQVPGGPPVLRGVDGPCRYGLAHLTPKQKEVVRVSNLLAVRTAQAFGIMLKFGRIRIVEQPAMRDREVSMLRLDEFARLMEDVRVTHTISTQCQFGAPSKKLTSWVPIGVEFTGLSAVCEHKPRKWYEATTATEVTAAHPPSRGRKQYYETREDALQSSGGAGQFVTRNSRTIRPF